MPRWTDERRRKYAATWERIRAGEGFIYVAQIENTDLYKIGFSLDPVTRIRRESVPGSRLLGFFPASLLAEKRLHRALLKHRTKRWGIETYRREAFDAPKSKRRAA